MKYSQEVHVEIHATRNEAYNLRQNIGLGGGGGGTCPTQILEIKILFYLFIFLRMLES